MKILLSSEETSLEKQQNPQCILIYLFIYILNHMSSLCDGSEKLSGFV